jgi:hypothetical protein
MAIAGQIASHKLAGNAALLAIRIATQGMQPAETKTLRRLFFGILDGDLAGKEILARSPTSPSTAP